MQRTHRSTIQCRRGQIRHFAEIIELNVERKKKKKYYFSPYLHQGVLIEWKKTQKDAKKQLEKSRKYRIVHDVHVFTFPRI